MLLKYGLRHVEFKTMDLLKYCFNLYKSVKGNYKNTIRLTET